MDRLNTTVLPAAGRLLMSFIFITGGWGKLIAAGPTIAYIASHGLPVPDAAYAVAVLIELGGGLLILFGLLTRPTALALAAWCLVTGALFHYVPGDRNMMVHLAKNVCMAGGFLQLAAYGAGTWSVDALRRRRFTAATV